MRRLPFHAKGRKRGLAGITLKPEMANHNCRVIFYTLFTSALAGFSTVAVEFNPHLAGAIFGLINTLGTFAGFFGPLTAGYMLAGSGGNWLLPFFVSAAVGVVCAAILFVVPVRPIIIETIVPTPVVAREAAH